MQVDLRAMTNGAGQVDRDLEGLRALAMFSMTPLIDAGHGKDDIGATRIHRLWNDQANCSILKLRNGDRIGDVGKKGIKTENIEGNGLIGRWILLTSWM